MRYITYKITPMKGTYGPKDFWQVKKEGNLKFNDAITPDDPRYVDLNNGRGDYDKALKYCNKSKSIAVKIGAKVLLEQITSNIKEAESKIKISYL